MGFNHTRAAWEAMPADLSASERLVLLALADDCRQGTDVCSPGHALLTERTGLRRTQLGTVIKRLISRGLVALHTAARRGRHARYRLMFAQVPAERAPSDPMGTTGGANADRGTGTAPELASPRKNILSRVRAPKRSSSTPKRQPWQEPSNAPTNRLRPAPRPDLSLLPDPPAWAVEAASGQLGRFAVPSAVRALARSLAGAA